MMLSWLFSDPLPAGMPAPDFTLSDDAGRSITLSKLRGRSVVLVFYPGDDTPGCTKQLCQFRDDWSEPSHAASKSSASISRAPASTPNSAKNSASHFLY